MADNESNVENLLSRAWGSVWWNVLLRGVVAIIFGLLVFFLPGLTVALFLLLFGAYAVGDGILLLLQAVTVKDELWWVRLLQGLVAIATGAAVFLWSGINALSLLYIIAFYLVLTGILQAITSIGLRLVIKDEWLYFKGNWLYFISGVLSAIVGVLLMIRPLSGAVDLAQTIGIFAISYGVFTCALALELREQPENAARPT
jgi:uncharacterized membrane protein HdeD (DUF308 family)